MPKKVLSMRRSPGPSVLAPLYVAAADHKSHKHPPHTTRHQHTMGHKQKEGAIERDIEHAAALAIDGFADGTYTNTEQAAAAIGIAETTLHRRLKEGKTRAEAWQLLTCQGEKALVHWISHPTALSKSEGCKSRANTEV